MGLIATFFSVFFIPRHLANVYCSYIDLFKRYFRNIDTATGKYLLRESRVSSLLLIVYCHFKGQIRLLSFVMRFIAVGVNEMFVQILIFANVWSRSKQILVIFRHIKLWVEVNFNQMNIKKTIQWYKWLKCCTI